MRAMILAVISLSLSGCGYYFTPRPPLAERKLGVFGSESIGALATSPDYRVVFVKLQADAVMCAEAPADAVAQSAAAAALQADVVNELDAKASAEMAITMKQLFQRSQGLALVRDVAFIYCNMYMNGALDRETYVAKMSELVALGTNLIARQIPSMGTPGYDSPPTPSLSGAGLPSEKKDGTTKSPPAAAESGVGGDGTKK